MTKDISRIGLIKKDEKYAEMIDELSSMLTEVEFTSRWILVEGYHRAGELIVKNYGNSISDESLQLIAGDLDRAGRMMRYAVRLYNKFPKLDDIPDGKSTSITRLIKEHLTEKKEEPEKIEKPAEKKEAGGNDLRELLSSTKKEVSSWKMKYKKLQTKYNNLEKKYNELKRAKQVEEHIGKKPYKEMYDKYYSQIFPKTKIIEGGKYSTGLKNMFNSEKYTIDMLKEVMEFLIVYKGSGNKDIDFHLKHLDPQYLYGNTGKILQLKEMLGKGKKTKGDSSDTYDRKKNNIKKLSDDDLPNI